LSPHLLALNSNMTARPKRRLAQRLQPGDRIGLIAPSSSITEERFEKALVNIRNLGFEPIPSPNAQAQQGYLAGTDEQRLQDLHQMFADDSIKGIWCIRGGYGSARLLPQIDYRLIRKNPKIIIGYSDITALLQGIYLRSGLVGFHGPAAASDFPDYTSRHVKALLMEPQSNYLIDMAEEHQQSEALEYQLEVIRSGTATGRLVGGNLSLISALAGTPYEWKIKNKIIFLEDIGEKPYRIDRMLTQLLQATDMRKAAAIILGIFVDCQPGPRDRSLSLSDALKDRLANLGIPVIYGMSFGHIAHQFTLPIGIKAQIDTQSAQLQLLEPAVR
ncbi:MAG: LD-carboxypeptidase, partial [Bacteroidota bacterium]